VRARQPAPRPPRPRFPRLQAAWGALLAASIAHADATPPQPPGTSTPGSASGDKSGADKNGDDKKAPCPTGQGNAPSDVPRKPGGLVHPRRTAGVKPRAHSPTVWVESDEGEFVIHPHGPDEPCKRRA
jgi:hypothetical protein